MSDGMGREFTYLSSHATNRYFIPNWSIYISPSKLKPKLHGLASLFFLPKENCPLEYMIWCLFYNKTAYFA